MLVKLRVLESFGEVRGTGTYVDEVRGTGVCLLVKQGGLEWATLRQGSIVTQVCTTRWTELWLSDADHIHA